MTLELLKLQVENPPTNCHHSGFHTVKWFEDGAITQKVVLIWGGHNGISKEIYELQIKNNLKWKQIEMKGNFEPRAAFASCCFNEFVFLFGGLFDDNSFTNQLIRMDFKKMEITEIPIDSQFPKLINSSMIYHKQNNDEFLTIYGGLMENMNIFNDTLQYNLNRKQSSMLQTDAVEKKIPGRESHTAVYFYVKKPLMVVYGGFIKKYQVQRVREILVLDLESGKWSIEHGKGNNPHGRALHSCSLHGNLMFIHGGYLQYRNQMGGWDWHRTNESYSLDLYTFQWTNLRTKQVLLQKNDSEAALEKAGHSSTICDNILLIFGGVVGYAAEPPDKATNELLVMQLDEMKPPYEYKIKYSAQTVVEWKSQYSNTTITYMIHQGEKKIATSKTHLILPPKSEEYTISIACESLIFPGRSSKLMDVKIKPKNTPFKVTYQIIDQATIKLKYPKAKLLDYVVRISTENSSFNEVDCADDILKVNNFREISVEVIELYKGEFISKDICLIDKKDLDIDIEDNVDESDIEEEVLEEGLGQAGHGEVTGDTIKRVNSVQSMNSPSAQNIANKTYSDRPAVRKNSSPTEPRVIKKLKHYSETISEENMIPKDRLMHNAQYKALTDKNDENENVGTENDESMESIVHKQSYVERIPVPQDKDCIDSILSSKSESPALKINRVLNQELAPKRHLVLNSPAVDLKNEGIRVKVRTLHTENMVNNSEYPFYFNLEFGDSIKLFCEGEYHRARAIYYQFKNNTWHLQVAFDKSSSEFNEILNLADETQVSRIKESQEPKDTSTKLMEIGGLNDKEKAEMMWLRRGTSKILIRKT
jgi:hypothetical protein